MILSLSESFLPKTNLWIPVWIRRTNLLPVGDDGTQNRDHIGLGGEVSHSEHSLQLLHDDYYRRPSHEPGNGRPWEELHQDPEPEIKRSFSKSFFVCVCVSIDTLT